jgi:hypothetical protein
MANPIKKLGETMHREKDEIKGKVKPKAEHGEEATRDTGNKLGQTVKELGDKLKG